MIKGGRRKTEDEKYGGREHLKHLALLVFLLSSSVFFQGCGKKGPPLAPLNLAPEMPQQATARRLGNTVYIQMKAPAKNATGRGAYSVDRIQVYGATVAPGAGLPKVADLVKPAKLLTEIAVRPPPDPDAPEPDEDEQKKDTRPGPGDSVTYVESLTDAQFVPHPVSPAEKPPKAPKARRGEGAKPQSGEGGPPPPPPGPAVLTRSYVLRGVARNGNLGAPTVRLDVPLLAAPGPARPGASPTWSESSVTIAWNPPAVASDEAPGVLYNVYAAAAPGSGATGAPSAPEPLNPKPLEETSFTHAGAEPGKQQCFVVRSVAAVGTATIESEPSEPICVTPKDTFPPAAPKSLTAVSDVGAVNLVWDANTESDLAGYVVLRGEAPGDNMQPLMPDPIKENRYVDRSVAGGTTYVYTVIAVDKAGNRSTPSNRVQETPR